MSASMVVEAGGGDALPLTREFPMRSDFRRCAWYAAIGLATLMATADLLRANGLAPQANPNRNWIDWAAGATIITFASLGFIIATHRWRMRIDEIGLSRRRIWGWDRWTWDEFSQGLIERQQGGFVSKSRPFWRNWLDLSLLSDSDQAFVLEACKHFFRAADPTIEFPDESKLKIAYQLTKSITLHEMGIEAKIGRRYEVLDWSQIQQVRLFHVDNWSKRLRKVEFGLPQQTLILEGVQGARGGDSRRYKATEPLVIPPIVEWFLRTHAPPEKLVCWSLSGPPSSLEECRCRQAQLRKKLRIFTWLLWTLPLGMLATTIGCMGPNLLPFVFGQVAFPNIGWKVLAALLGLLTFLSQPLLIGLVLNYLRSAFAAASKELDEWERTHSGLAS